MEHLRVGDLAVTSTGAHQPIRWLGHRVTDCRRHPDPSACMPVRVAAHAFGPDRPARDLRVSPGHALCVDVGGEVLIPAMALVNGTTITREEVDAVTYWHVELDTHDILLAENMGAESYLDMGNRPFFAEAGVIALNASPDAHSPLEAAARTHADFCRPFHMDGAPVEVVRAHLRARAAALGWALEADDTFAGLHLMVDGIRVDPVTRGLQARFAVPAGAREVWLVSGHGTSLRGGRQPRRPAPRRLRRRADGGRRLRPAARARPPPTRCSAPASTPARAPIAGPPAAPRLPAALWADDADGLYLRVTLAGPALPRWVAPAAVEPVVQAPVVQAPVFKVPVAKDATTAARPAASTSWWAPGAPRLRSLAAARGRSTFG